MFFSGQILICKSYLLEAKWYFSGYTPNLQEYFENAWITVTAPVMLLPAYFFISNPITKKALDCLELEYPSILRHSSMLVRLADDLGTSSVSELINYKYYRLTQVSSLLLFIKHSKYNEHYSYR